MYGLQARKLEKAGAIGGIIMDNVPDSSADSFPLFAMSGDGKDNVNIPVVFLFTREAKTLIEAVTKEPTLNITLSQLHAGTKPFFCFSHVCAKFRKFQDNIYDGIHVMCYRYSGNKYNTGRSYNFRKV